MKPKIKVGDRVWVAGFANSRRVRNIDGKYAFVTGIGWGLKSACVLDKTRRSLSLAAILRRGDAASSRLRRKEV